MADPLFRNLESAGHELARALELHRNASPIILGIAAGGVPAAYEVAKHLGAPLDIVVKQTLYFRSDGSPASITSVAGVLVRGEAHLPETPATPLEISIVDRWRELEQRVQTCRGDAPPASITGQTVLLVDDGIRTGGTIRTVIGAIRALQPARLVVAVPVAAAETREALEREADESVVLAWRTPFGHVGMFYARFEIPNDEQIRHMYEKCKIPSLPRSNT